MAHALQTWAVILVADQCPGSLVDVGYGHEARSYRGRMRGEYSP